MADVFSKQKRSELMRQIKSKGNKKTELLVLEILRKNHISGWRRNLSLYGKPDFAFRRERIAIFLDGCFWHLCPKHGRCPEANRGYWEAKLHRNRERDREVNKELRRRGWRVVRFWEHELKEESLFLLKLLKSLNQQI
ncbi:MAG: very short patch repair endonuclease [Verrucomicrobiota bacterium]|jgi:DNA mismatch endonuclease (patch repair protein)